MGSNTTNTAGGGSATGTSNNLTIKNPYEPAQTLINQAIQQANDYHTMGYMDPSPTQAAANNLGTYAAAQTQNAITPWNSAVNGSASNGITPEMLAGLSQLGGIASGANGINTGGMYSNLYNQAQPLASNYTGALTDTQSQILNDNASRIAARQASLYSGAGRYGSEGAGIGMARGIAETNNPLIAQFNQQGIQNSLAAQGLQYNAAQGLTGVQGQNVNNQMNAANSQLNQYGQGQQRAQQWAGMAPSLFNLAMSPLQTQLQAEQYTRDEPWRRVSLLGQSISPLMPMLANSGVQVSAGDTTGVNTTTGSTSTPTPWTTYAGLGLAGIGALSDRRLKTDITKLGKDPHTSLNIYAFRYKGDPKNYPKVVGPMAQEVQKKYPEAVGELPGGILYLKGPK